MEIDKVKHYVCFNCEEEIYWGTALSGKIVSPDSEEFNQRNMWRHTSTEAPACNPVVMVATPSNIEVVVPE